MTDNKPSTPVQSLINKTVVRNSFVLPLYVYMCVCVSVVSIFVSALETSSCFSLKVPGDVVLDLSSLTNQSVKLGGGLYPVRNFLLLVPDYSYWTKLEA